MALHKVPEGTVVVAEVQTSGRGRLGREWFSPKGGLWFSVVLRPKTEASEAAKLVFAASLAVADALGEFCGLHAETKWPNDVLVKGKKICGILAEINSTGKNVNYAVVGVGLNANFKVKEALPKEVVETATSIEDLILDLHHKLNTSAVIVTHQLTTVYKIADRIVMLHNGKVIEAGTPDETIRSSDPTIKHFITGKAS